ncbi:hypothetical protein F4818DRAFT_457784 [Hypoxylon cercidicola]|nr:hypothetical protein F4818DRAFT_457784 [Hypoxylon cercidicola]
MKSELALLDKKYDADGHEVYGLREAKADDGNAYWCKLYALAETRHYRESGEFKRTRLHVNPQPLKQLLQDVLVDFSYDPVDAQQDVDFDLPAHCLFFYRKVLEQVGTERFKDDETSLGHLKLLLDWIDKLRASVDGIRPGKPCLQSRPSPTGVAVKKSGPKYGRFNLSGRIVVDCKNYQRFEPDEDFELEDLPGTEAAKRQRVMRKYNEGIDTSDETIYDELSEEDLIVANSTVRGFAFSTKKFLEFFVDNISPIKWDESCFEQLVLNPTTKKTVQAMVSMHARRGQDQPGFDDIVEGKGKGLVMVLHGPPGTDSYTLETNLGRIMDITSTWCAVLLIDEADIFLARRNLTDLQRNAMVTVSLRVLEYYRGILFLTTNRVGTFDDAFTSRIHVPLRYSNLNEASRRTIWGKFCGRVPGGVEISDKELDELAKHQLNGRQIKNIVKAAESLAAFDGRKLDYAQLQAFTQVQGEFERDWMGFVDVDE